MSSHHFLIDVRHEGTDKWSFADKDKCNMLAPGSMTGENAATEAYIVFLRPKK